METQVVVLCVLGDILGLLSMVLGIVGEMTKTKPSETTVDGWAYCDYSKSSGVGLAISASFMLILSQILIAIAGRCCGCCRTNATINSNTACCSITMSIFSWFAFIISIILFGLAALYNSMTGQHLKVDATCPHLVGVFASAAVLALVAVSLGTGAAFMLDSTTTVAAPTIIAMQTTTGTPSPTPTYPQYGQPQFQVPPTGAPPAFYGPAAPTYN